MSILGYSSSYFLPEYWAGTPLYGEKIIPLVDYILSTDFVDSARMAGAFYNIVNKYRNPEDLPVDQIKAIIEESGYYYILNLLGEDDDSIKLLMYLLVLVHQLKGSKKGLQLVLDMLKKGKDPLVMTTIGTPTVTPAMEASNFSVQNYVMYSGLTTDTDPFDFIVKFRTGEIQQEQCIFSVSNYRFKLNILSNGRLSLSLGNDGSSWNIADSLMSTNILMTNTNYIVRASFDGLRYTVGISTDGKKFADYLSMTSTEALKINKAILYVGVDKSTGIAKTPFKGSINLSTLATDVSNVNIEEWWESEEVGPEDTFKVEAELDLSLLNSNFFQNFSSFAKKYVYPTLTSFNTKMTLNNAITFIPYIRERVTYTIYSDLASKFQFRTKEGVNAETWEDFFVVDGDDSGIISYDVSSFTATSFTTAAEGTPFAIEDRIRVSTNNEDYYFTVSGISYSGVYITLTVSATVDTSKNYNKISIMDAFQVL